MVVLALSTELDDFDGIFFLAHVYFVMANSYVALYRHCVATACSRIAYVVPRVITSTYVYLGVARINLS